MNIGGMVKSTFLDYPGKIACVLFTQGCSYDCFYCHNRELVASKGTLLGQEKVGTFLDSRKDLLQGVVISGGEPTLQPDLPDYCSWIKEKGFLVKLDTNGNSPEVLEKLLFLQLVDYIALDVKAPWERYGEICGKGARPQTVIESLSLLKGSNICWETRTTVAPTLGKTDLRKIACQMPKVPLWRLNRYRLPACYKKDEEKKIHTPAPDCFEVQGWIDELKIFQGAIVTFSK
ncbi:anaerobic ribonucleoside-triphosphate reductase activating protein [Sphaerochaeta pleomorpha str. Grapes]|uniref:Anaerobic ribonucleoside-triphosphate reductase activating protein n=1 Tax=Sphaerochaeta pleomorpha (strain ATCC BAA-1885 / DSM 22778 / Grapes) TaxID=158190 RepID=G8QYS9_SPHPG|nr:anaerobic ribonucleoside-triphosphate reductase activating protein [Sphaerochaeta pleomorpha]AEV29706.1 anaerobic ribonucleoside-triphosphate reductase activating protein [Sphaerochaeta pleomorpha str. Grapes]